MRQGTDLRRLGPRVRPERVKLWLSMDGDGAISSEWVLTPTENSAPGTCTGRNSVDPAVRCFVSILPYTAQKG